MILNNRTNVFLWKWGNPFSKQPCEHFLNLLYSFNIQGNICPYFIFAPFVVFCPHCPWAKLRLREFQCLRLSLFKYNCVFANSRQIHTVCKCRRLKITWGWKEPCIQYLPNYKWSKLTVLVDLWWYQGSEQATYSICVTGHLHHRDTLHKLIIIWNQAKCQVFKV